MTTKQFKQHLRDNKDKLRGCSLNVTYKGQKTWFKSLNDFGIYLLTILTEDSYCYINNDFGISFGVMDNEPSNEIPKMTESQRHQGIYNQLKDWGTTV